MRRIFLIILSFLFCMDAIACRNPTAATTILLPILPENTSQLSDEDIVLKVTIIRVEQSASVLTVRAKVDQVIRGHAAASEIAVVTFRSSCDLNPIKEGQTGFVVGTLKSASGNSHLKPRRYNKIDGFRPAGAI